MRLGSYRTISFAMLGLLAMTTGYYIFRGRISEAMDSLTWYVLLILFLLETFKLSSVQSRRAVRVMRIVRIAASAVLLGTLFLYLHEWEWVDAINLTLWLLVVALMETEVRQPDFLTTHRKAFSYAAAALYLSLAAIIMVWLYQGAWIDAWDGVLWLAAFGLLELKLLSAPANINARNNARAVGMPKD